MNDELKPLDVTKISDNCFDLIANDWFLISAGSGKEFNSMTASWGGFGELWNKKVCFVFVRPVRYTYEFTEHNDTFSLCFFEEKYRPTLKLCGTKSGREIDKIAGLDITPVDSESGTVYFAEAKLVLECRKVYIHDLDPKNFIDPIIHESYPEKDYHRMYVGEIISCLSR